MSTNPPLPPGEFRPSTWHAILDAAPGGLCLVDPIDGRIIELNERQARMLGRSRAGLRGHRCQDLIHPNDLPHDLRAVSALLRGAVDSVDRVKRWRRADGSFVAARSCARLAELPGEDRQVFWVWTEPVEHALPAPVNPPTPQVQGAAPAELSAPRLAPQSAFLDNIGHEIRTPLAVISGLTDLLRREAGDARAKRRLNQLFETTQHLLGVVNDILDLSSLQTGELVLRPAPFRLGALLERVQRLHAGQAREKGLAFSVNADAALRSLVLDGDELRLAQVLAKLCGNAVKFTQRGAVDVSVQALRLDDAGAHLRFSVADTGPGVPLELRAHLFQPFVQGDATSARRHGGTGLGLAFVQRILALMEGTILLRSESGAGSTFEVEVWLPRSAPAAQMAPAGHAPVGVADLRGLRVLLAEDHPLSQEILCDMLESLGCEVLIAADGAEALELFRSGTQDLVLMDMQMPGMDGLEATRRIRALPSGVDTPIIGLTANITADDRQRCLDAGMNEHLGKPIGQAQLEQALSRWVPPSRRRVDGLPARAPAASPQEHDLDADAALQEAVSALPGIRLDNAWRQSTQRLRSLQTLLQRFVQTQAVEVAQLRAHLLAGRSEAARAVAHALAGAAGMVGVWAVMEPARTVEGALRQGQAPEQLMAGCELCETAISRLAAALERLPQPVPETASTSPLPGG